MNWPVKCITFVAGIRFHPRDMVEQKLKLYGSTLRVICMVRVIILTYSERTVKGHSHLQDVAGP